MLEIALIYTAIIGVELGVLFIKSLDVYYYFHDSFDTSNIGKPGYLGPQSWRRILRGALTAALPLLVVIWVLSYLNGFYAAIAGFIGIFIYNLLLRGLISDEISERRAEDWRYGWF